MSAASLPKLRDSDERATRGSRECAAMIAASVSSRAAVVDEEDFPALARRRRVEDCADPLDEGQDACSSFFTGTTTDSSGATMPRLTRAALRSPTEGDDSRTGFLRG